MFGRGETVVRQKYTVGPKDDYGQTVVSYVDETWENVAFAPGLSDEPKAGGSTRVVTPATLYDPLARPVDPRDRFIVRGRTYMVDGDGSGAWANPWTGHSPGGTVTLRAVNGG